MKKLLILFAFALLPLLGSQAWAETATLTLASNNQWSASKSTLYTDENTVTWSFSYVGDDGAISSFESTRGFHVGTSNKAVASVNVKVSGINGTINSIKVNTCTAGSNRSLSCKVQSTDFTCNGSTTQSLTSTATEYTFVGSASGEVNLNWTGTSQKKAIYIKSIEITYTPGGNQGEGGGNQGEGGGNQGEGGEQGGETPGAGTAFYTWTHDTSNGTNNAYANYDSQTVNGIAWKLQGNATESGGHRLGGKSLSGADRDLHTETAMGSAISKIVLYHGAKSNNLTINSVSLLVADNANFNNATTVALPDGHNFGSAGEFEFTGNWAKDSYYKIVFNVTNNTKNNHYLPITKIEFFAPAQGGGEGGDPGTDPTPEATVNIDLADGEYIVGQTVNITWANLGGLDITIKKGDTTVASCDNETLGSFSYTFDTSGTYVLSIEALDANADELDTPDRTYTIVAVEIDPVNSYFTSTTNPASLNAGTYAILLNKDGSTGASSNTDATSLNGVSKTSLNGDVKIEFSNGTNNSNYPLVWGNDGTIRIYQNNTLTITPLNGKVIKEVTFNGTVNLTCATEGLDRGTWTGESADALVFAPAASGKNQFNYIKVVTGIAVPAPQFVVNGTALTGDNATLTSGTTVALAADGVETIYYNLNGGDAFIEYTEPIAITAETHIWAKSILNREESPLVDMTFYVLTQKTIAQFVNDKPVGDAQVTGPLTVYYIAPYTDPDTNEAIKHIYVKDQAGDYMRVHFAADAAPAVAVGQTLGYVLGKYNEVRGQEILASGYGTIAGTAAEVAPEVETVAEFYTNPKNYQYVKVETVNISPAPGENIYALYDEDMAHIKIEDKFDYVTVPYDHADHSHDVVGILIYETDEQGEPEYRFVPTAFYEAAVAAPVCTTPVLNLEGYNEAKGGYPKGTHLNFTAAEGETVYYTLNGAMPKADDENTYEFVGTNVFNRVGTFTLIAIANAEGKTPSNATDPISITIYDPNAVEVTETKTHTLNADKFKMSGTAYTTYTYTEDGVEYSIFASKSNGMQMNTKDNKNNIRKSGLVVTENNGYTLKSIKVEYYASSTKKSLNVYTCDDKYTSADNLFGNDIQGDLCDNKLTDSNTKVEFEEGVAYAGLKPTEDGATNITTLTFVWEKTVEGAPSETIAPETRRYKLVKSESELIDGILHGDRFVLATPYDNKYYAMSTDDRGNYRESVVVELEADGETLIVPRNSDVQPISLFVDNDQDVYFFNVGTNRYLKATKDSKHHFNTIELDDRTTEEAETASAKLSFYDENRDVPYGVQIQFQNAVGATIAFNFNLNGDRTNNVPLLRWACYDNNANNVQLPQLFHMVTENGFDRTAETITETHSTNHIALHTDGETWVANKMELTDGMAYALDVDVETPHVKYLRNIKANLVGTWQPLYVPFDIDDWSDFATEVIQFAGADANGLKFTYVTTGTPLQAHELYIFKPKAETTAIHFRTGTTTVKAAPDEDVASDSYTYNDEVYTMHGTYTGVSGDDMRATGAYALSGGDFKRASASNPGLKAFRIYLTIKDATTGTPSVKAPQKVAFHVVDPEQTGIESVSVDAQETSEEYFDLTGRRVVEPTTGLYIQSGRKVIIRK